MEWTDEAIVLAVRPHGETSAILEVLTRTHGRHLGLLRGGTSRKNRPMLQPGNSLLVHWRARLAEHLGNYSAELTRARAGDMMERSDALTGLNAFSSVACAALPEREPHGAVFEVGTILLDAIMTEEFSHWGPLFVRWEAGLLDELGFGLDLSRCAATGDVENLIFVSPRSGRAVSADAGKPYADRLLRLPGFLLGSQNSEVTAADIVAGLRLTAHFLLERALTPHNREIPHARLRLEEFAGRESK